MLVLYLLVLAAFAGLAARWLGARFVPLYAAAAFLGGLAGAFLAFGDAPFLLRRPYLNPFTLALAGAVVAFGLVWRWRGAGARRQS